MALLFRKAIKTGTGISDKIIFAVNGVLRLPGHSHTIACLSKARPQQGAGFFFRAIFHALCWPSQGFTANQRISPMRRAVLMLTILAALPAVAQQAAVDPSFATYHGMLKQLRSAGIDPAQVAWAEVNPLCTGFMTYTDDQTGYNHCLYDKAVLAVAYANDREACNIESLAVTPESLRRQPSAVISSYNPGTDDGTHTIINTPRLSRTELRTQRSASYNRCMRDAGWKSPRNWRLGYAQ